ncbi:glycosyltransferase [Arcobacter sp.]|uniref:glycosyltransferase n=1 Tax=Arcobacter sp. TaxID=1872629 RepID=UPI003D09DAEA
MDKRNKKIDPLVSIIITTYNRSNFLKRALDSAITQTYQNIEIIIVDDASSDDTNQIIKEYMSKDKRIVYLKNPIQSGANVSRNKGIKYAKGRFIAGLDDDDEFTSNRISLLVNNYDKNFSFITSNNIIVQDGHFINTEYKEIVSLKDMLYNNVIGNQGLIEKERLLSVGLYDNKLLACQDYDMWMKLILKYGHIKVINEITQIIYLDSSYTRISTNSRKKFLGYFAFYKKYKYLMSEKYRKFHLIRIYDIKSKNTIACELAIKLLISKIKSSKIKSFSIFGINSISIEIIKFMNNNNIKINYLIDSNKFGKKFDTFTITKFEDILNLETNFIICSVSSYDEIKNMILNNIEEKLLNLIHI